MDNLTTEERGRIVDQALVLIEQLYVHLPLKRAMHAVDPIQRLRLLRHRLRRMTDLEFHGEMVQTFTRLRDLHTNYILPEPFRSYVAYLPFRIQEFFRGSRCQYLITEVSDIVDDPYFTEGVVVTHWNGVPIERAIGMNADREAGSNPEARHACGLDAMTTRPLAMSLPPDESWVVVTYRAGRQERERRFEWRVKVHDLAEEDDPLASRGKAARLLGLDAKLELVRRTRRILFAPKAVEAERQARGKPRRSRRRRPAAAEEGRDFFSAVQQTPDVYVSDMPRVFSCRAVETPHGTFGYVRIRTFLVDDDEEFVQEFIRIVGLLPQNGLILDVRSNGGGNILAGERLLQVLTPGRIDPERLHFINTPLTLKLCQHNHDIAQWRKSIAQAVETGSTFSQGFPLLPVESYNDIGQKYHGPVVLLTDALCYSTTDIFSAGFQDHGIGVILGTSRNTGAGGANVWDHDILLHSLSGADSPFKPLPKGASFRVSIRRTTRVGARAGEPLEDLGVKPDLFHKPTRNDVLKDNVDLIKRAAKILEGMTVQSLSASTVKGRSGAAKLAAHTQNIGRLDLLFDGRGVESRDVSDGVTKFKLPSPRRGKVAELRGFRDGQLVASTRVRL